mmetsp:Transcript_14058/g.26279  ORF Transcript_14058/g.26279 Transcript_14058/m.26279 type:complete len:219 (-) Transcript_14058:35-691(-)
MLQCCCENDSGTSVEAVTAGLVEDRVQRLDFSQTAPDSTPSKGRKMVISFERRDGTEQEVAFFHKPLGLDCSGHDPIVVQRVRKNAPADKASVRVNWVVRAIDGVRAPADLMSLMQARASELPEEPKANQVVLTFSTPGTDSQAVDVVFQHQPWGVMFTKSVPIRVKGCRPGSYSERLGVKKDWVLVSADGDPVPERLDQLMDLIQEKVARLPREVEE